MSRREDGAVTAELALAMPAIVLMLALVTGIGRVVVAQVQCVDAARAGARAAARNEPPSVVVATATAVAPRGARTSIAGGAATVTVVVRTRVAWWGVGFAPITVEGRAVADVEPTATVGSTGGRAADGGADRAWP